MLKNFIRSNSYVENPRVISPSPDVKVHRKHLTAITEKDRDQTKKKNNTSSQYFFSRSQYLFCALYSRWYLYDYHVSGLSSGVLVFCFFFLYFLFFLQFHEGYNGKFNEASNVAARAADNPRGFTFHTR